MTNLHPPVLVIENTLDDNSTYAVSNYGTPYIRLDSVPHNRTATELLTASLFGFMTVDAFQAKQWFLFGTSSLAIAACSVSAVFAFTRWREIGKLVKRLKAPTA